MSKVAQQLQGTVVAFNLSPRGELEGALIETASGIAQLNFPKHDGETMAKSLQVGDNVDLLAKLEPDEGEHPVFRADREGRVTGKIVRLNYARHGEANGYHLDDGTFVHVKPEGAREYKLSVGDQIQATGERRAGADAVVIEARSVDLVSKRVRKRARA